MKCVRFRLSLWIFLSHQETGTAVLEQRQSVTKKYLQIYSTFSTHLTSVACNSLIWVYIYKYTDAVSSSTDDWRGSKKINANAKQYFSFVLWSFVNLNCFVLMLSPGNGHINWFSYELNKRRDSFPSICVLAYDIFVFVSFHMAIRTLMSFRNWKFTLYSVHPPISSENKKKRN